MAGQQEQFSYLYNHIVDIPPKNTTHMLKLKYILCSELIGEFPERIPTPWVSYGSKIQERSSQIIKMAIEGLGEKKKKSCLVGINLSAGMARREWPLDKYALFINDSIKKYEDKIDGWVILNNPGAPDKAVQLTQAVHHPKLISIEAQKDFRVVLEILTYFRLIVSPDTSIVHAASAMGIPVCVMTIGQSANVWNPVGVPYVLVRSTDYYSLHDLTVNEVNAGFDKLINKLSL
jgi:ADP-heptose:LPS heptosyltransferase